jgi:hypothetical protein
MMVATSVGGAELPSQIKKSKPADSQKHCNIAGYPGVLAANGVCVRLSGFISAQFSGGGIK